MSIVTLLPFIVLIGAMFLMTRSAKKKQQQAAQMRNEMQPGTGVRTIGGMYATVKEIGDETVLLEIAPGTHAVYAKNAIGAVLEDAEYNRIVHGDDDTVVPDDASSLTEAAEATEADTTAEAAGTDTAAKADLTKKVDAAEADTEVEKDGKTDGETDAK
ncbi:preprotein translocase subunit YajC [Streptomyces sp. NBC_01216]|uniref:preprotein translocase subunit YajC n=1 Tax=unclassified Streptomyces TaxID=2593676 RepID=UPI002E153B9D|nr:preprotein translocase subunit YajC [Streptomyces sp. NBC_01216]